VGPAPFAVLTGAGIHRGASRGQFPTEAALSLPSSGIEATKALVATGQAGTRAPCSHGFVSVLHAERYEDVERGCASAADLFAPNRPRWT
jgi:hypothetical protein